MTLDRPGSGSGRSPLDDLRERLARLPDNHPSSPGYAGASPPRPGPDVGRGAGPAGESGPDGETGPGREGGPGREAGLDGKAGPGADSGPAGETGAVAAVLGWGRSGHRDQGAAADRGATMDRLRRLDHLARVLGWDGDGQGGAGGRGGGGQPRVDGASRPAPGLLGRMGPLGGRGREPYRPWFADVDAPWFTEGHGPG